VQNAWLEAWRCLGNYREGAAFQPWLFGIAKHRVERLRRGKRLVTPLDEANELVTPDDIREELQSKREEEQLRQCLDRLRPEERTAVELRCFEEMTYEEIAAVTRCNLGTVRSRLARAKRRLSSWVFFGGEHRSACRPIEGIERSADSRGRLFQCAC
jgi:RNA polymerase sigma-70 factor, ECF subfamily